MASMVLAVLKNASATAGARTEPAGMIVIGLDPGTHGAIAALHGNAVSLLADLPVHVIAAKGRGDRAELDVHALHGLIAELGPIEHAFIEKVTARPGNGSVSMFRFGQACGAIYATLAVMGIPLTYVLPRVWQAHHGIGPTPDAARQRAAQLYPQIAPQLARKADGNRADALLIAAYGRQASNSVRSRATKEVAVAQLRAD
jgi:crossover junction endodeoxyribonuclease RuvC